MDSTLFTVLTLSIYAIYFMLPAYLANVSALAFGGGSPIDFKHNFPDGHRILGDGKTWNGAIIGILVGILVGIIQGLVSLYVIDGFNNYSPLSQYYYNILPTNIVQGALLGLFMGAGAIIGDLCGSFIKRRINIKRGGAAPLLDQLDFIIGALLFVSILVSIPLELIVLIIILTLFLHLGSNIIAYLIGMKDVWY
jgi:CDP-2,3-bis-(O-geranylgeranyl)-sn-glycerol synthase